MGDNDASRPEDWRADGPWAMREEWVGVHRAFGLKVSSNLALRRRRALNHIDRRVGRRCVCNTQSIADASRWRMLPRMGPVALHFAKASMNPTLLGFVTYPNDLLLAEVCPYQPEGLL